MMCYIIHTIPVYPHELWINLMGIETNRISYTAQVCMQLTPVALRDIEYAQVTIVGKPLILSYNVAGGE